MRESYFFLVTILLSVLFVSGLLAQNPIPNAGFENWTDGNPDEWLATNAAGFYTTGTASGISHSGNYAFKGEVISYMETVIPPTIINASAYIPISGNYTRLTGYYQMTNMGEDAFYAEAIFYDASFAPVAIGIAELGPTTGGWQMFSVDMEYIYGNSNPVANAYIWFTIGLASEASGDNVTPGSNFLLDDLALDMASSVEDELPAGTPHVFALGQNYPNPFNPSTTIGFSLPSAERAVLKVFNSLGQQVAILVDEYMTAGVHQVRFDPNTLPSGLYYYRLQAGSHSSVRKMMLVR